MTIKNITNLEDIDNLALGELYIDQSSTIWRKVSDDLSQLVGFVTQEAAEAFANEIGSDEVEVKPGLLNLETGDMVELDKRTLN